MLAYRMYPMGHAGRQSIHILANCFRKSQAPGTNDALCAQSRYPDYGWNKNNLKIGTLECFFLVVVLGALGRS